MAQAKSSVSGKLKSWGHIKWQFTQKFEKKFVGEVGIVYLGIQWRSNWIWNLWSKHMAWLIAWTRWNSVHSVHMFNSNQSLYLFETMLAALLWLWGLCWYCWVLKENTLSCNPWPHWPSSLQTDHSSFWRVWITICLLLKNKGWLCCSLLQN